MELTDKYYQENYQTFYDTTVNADVSDLYARFLKYVSPGAYILDFGCGSGRDTKAFIDKGFSVVAMDKSADLCRLAGELTGADVKCADFSELSEMNTYDAVWACASLLHVKYSELLSILSKVYCALKNKGIIYMSFKLGDFEGYRNGRWYTDMNEDRFRSLGVDEIGFEIVEIWYSSDVRKDVNDKWFNVILKKK